jgi:hypothetical protein
MDREDQITNRNDLIEFGRLRRFSLYDVGIVFKNTFSRLNGTLVVNDSK